MDGDRFRGSAPCCSDGRSIGSPVPWTRLEGGSAKKDCPPAARCPVPTWAAIRLPHFALRFHGGHFRCSRPCCTCEQIPPRRFAFVSRFGDGCAYPFPCRFAGRAGGRATIALSSAVRAPSVLPTFLRHSQFKTRPRRSTSCSLSISILRLPSTPALTPPRWLGNASPAPWRP